MTQCLSASTAAGGRLCRCMVGFGSRRKNTCKRHGALQVAVKAARIPLMGASAAHRPATAAPPEASLAISVAPTTVTLADGTTVTLVDPAPRRLLPQQQPGPGFVTWTGLFGILALSATALVAAAATCFMLYVRPMLQAMTVTLAEMEAAAKDMQQAADHVESTSQLLQAQLPSTLTAVQGAAGEVQELAGNINKAAKLLTPTRLLRRSSSSSEVGSSSSGGKQGADGSSADASILGPSSLLEGIRELGFGLSSSSSNSVTSVLPQLQNLAAMPGGMTDFWGSQEEDDAGRRSSNPTSGGGSSSSSSSVRTVWDALAVTLSSANASKRSLVRLRSDLKAAVNVLSVLMGPAGSMLAPAAAAADKHDEQLQRQQQDTAECEAAAAVSAAQEVAEVAVVAAAEDDTRGPVSSMDGRIRIAAGVRLAGSAAVLRSMTEEDIESALAANANNRPGTSSSSSGSNSSISGSSSAAASAPAQNHVSTSKGTTHPTQSSTGTTPDVKQSELDGSTLVAVAVAAAVASPPETTTAADISSSAQAATAAAPEVVTAEAAAGSKSHSSSLSSRKRQTSRRIEEDEWGLPSVTYDTSDNDSSSSSSNSSSEGQVVQDAAEASASVSPDDLLPAADGADAPVEMPCGRGGGSQANRSAGSSYSTSTSSGDEEEDYAGYKDSSDADTTCHSTSGHSVSGAVAAAAPAHGSRGSGSVLFAGYDAHQDTLLSCDVRSDDGITWTQINQDPHLMRRVFCDNQEEVLLQRMSSSRQQQPAGRDAHSHL